MLKELIEKIYYRLDVLRTARINWLNMAYRECKDKSVAFSISTTGTKRNRESLAISDPQLQSRLIEILDRQAELDQKEVDTIQDKIDTLTKIEEAL